MVVMVCRPILHQYANEDVSLGAWFIGLEVEHIDDRNMCCGTPPGKTYHFNNSEGVLVDYNQYQLPFFVDQAKNDAAHLVIFLVVWL